MIIFLPIILIILILSLFLSSNKNKEAIEKLYISSDANSIYVYDLKYEKKYSLNRGIRVDVYKYSDKKDDIVYKKIKYDDKYYMIDSSNLTSNKKEIIKEKEMYVRTNLTLYKDDTSSKILSLIKKGEKVDILGYDKISKGYVNKYKVKYNDLVGYVYSKYLVNNIDDSKKLYDENSIQKYMAKQGNTLGGGTATNLDYYPYEKANFKDNKMPDEVRALYINSGNIKYIDEYIKVAKDSNINAFVIDIKDNTSPSYNSPVMLEYSKTNYAHALNDYTDYKNYINKAKETGFYLIGRITTFKDSYYVNDNKSSAIKDSMGNPFSHNGSYWPSVYDRNVWEFNVELAKEAVKEIGFNEIQFDYVRFPDRTTKLEKDGIINLGNTYNEEKAEAIQTFVMYACDEIHSVGAYVSIDVFGESALNYVTAYGQYWAAISNVADVISAMPYPDHFSIHEFGINEVVWTVPYKLLDTWSKYVVEKQKIIPTPAKVRTWIQAYDTKKTPSVVYDENKVADEIKALYDNGLTGGYMTWNASSKIEKYKSISNAFRRKYK